uniref:Uncharacterized protein n=1 Tax=Romanomermis culicivorax TaxID=13658 RepID=A0A915JGY6_ROMCU
MNLATVSREESNAIYWSCPVGTLLLTSTVEIFAVAVTVAGERDFDVDGRGLCFIRPGRIHLVCTVICLSKINRVRIGQMNMVDELLKLSFLKLECSDVVRHKI